MSQNLIDGILRSRYLNYRIIAASDVLLSVFSTFLSLTLLVGFFRITLPTSFIFLILGLSAALSICCFWALRTYRGIIRHSGLLESFRLKVVAETVDRVATVREMKRIVPEFKSKNSIYEELDHESRD